MGVRITGGEEKKQGGFIELLWPAIIVVFIVGACGGFDTNAATPTPKTPSELTLASPDGNSTITLRATNDGATIRLSRHADGKDISACIKTDSRAGTLELTDSKGSQEITAEDIRSALSAIGR